MAQSDGRKIFVDFEWHDISNQYMEQRAIATHEIIEFGAIMLDSGHEELGQFKSYVKPRYVPKLAKAIQKLTDISDEMLADAPDFSDVLSDFLAWCETGEDPYRIYSWSNSDLFQIKEEMELKNVPQTESTAYLLENWFDLQHEFDVTLGFERQISLSDALYAAGIDAVGAAHDALDDARNTATLFRFLNDPVKQQTTIKNIRSVLIHEEMSTTLGDLFDWSKLMPAPETPEIE